MNIFVGNLAEAVSDVELAELFKAFGQVKSVEVKRELFTGKCRGFAFVEMPGKNHSLAAIAALNGKEFCGQPLKVHEARDRPNGGGRRR
jgi:RNA recognition motif-containing protein